MHNLARQVIYIQRFRVILGFYKLGHKTVPNSTRDLGSDERGKMNALMKGSLLLKSTIRWVC